jgi:F0F1-type ATP synthase gamma subunit
MDGGTVFNTNMVSAIERCRETAKDEEITMDIVLCGSHELDLWQNKSNALSTYLRYHDLQKYYKGFRDVYEFK